MDNNFNNAVFLNLEYKNKNMKVYLSGTPNNKNINNFIDLCRRNNISDVLCFCELKYDPMFLLKSDIDFHHLEFTDGNAPDAYILNKFDAIIDDIIDKNTNDVINIHFHCNAGLGRAPTMLAYLMISRYKWNRINCVDKIRKIKKHSINSKQLDWILGCNLKKNNSCIIL